MSKTLFTLFALMLLAVNMFVLYPKYQHFHDEEKFSATPEALIHADRITKIVEGELHNGLISSKNFEIEQMATSAPIFASLLERMEGVNVFRMKVWNDGYHVLWSDIPALIGQHFADNHELEEIYEDGNRAIEGKLDQSSHTAKKTETASERSYNHFLEVYVPIKVEGRVVGVIEAYVAAEDVVNTYRTAFYLALMKTLAGSVLLFGLVVLLFRLKTRNT